MADVKWIKVAIDIFEDEKIKLIESMPSSDSILIVWFKMLTLAGKQNNNGVFVMNERIAYTDEMLATIFRMDVSTVRMALQTFEKFGMIELMNDVITISNWNKYQTLDSIEKKKERDRKYQAKRRAAQKSLVEKSSDKSSDVAISEEEREEELEEDKKEKEKEKEKSSYGEMCNVMLTEEERSKLGERVSGIDDLIERMSSYIASSGKQYKSHYAALLNWARRDGLLLDTSIAPRPPGMDEGLFSDFERWDIDAEEVKAW